MTQPIPRQVHGPIDYLYAIVVGAAPFVLGFSSVPSATFAAIGLALVVLVVTLLTRAEWGAFRVIPYRVHLLLDIAGGFSALAAPWLLGFADVPVARNFFLIVGLFALIAVSLSKPEEMGTVRAGAV